MEVKEKLLLELEDVINDFKSIGISTVRRIRTYIYSPGICKFIDDRHLEFNNILYACFDDIDLGLGGKEWIKYIKWLHNQLQEILKLIDEFRNVEKDVLELLTEYSNDGLDTNSLCKELKSLISKMKSILVTIANHKIQKVSKQIDEIFSKVESSENKTEIPDYYKIRDIRNKYLDLNQQVIASTIEKNPEIMEIDIKDIEEYLDDDFYSGIECDIQNWICENSKN